MFKVSPLSDWTYDRKHLDDYLLTRPDLVGKQTVQSTDDPDYDPDTITSITELDAIDPDPPAYWDTQCGYIGDLNLDIRQSEFDNEKTASMSLRRRLMRLMRLMPGTTFDDGSIEMSSADFVKVLLGTC